MAIWQENLFNNLLTVIILLSLAVIIYSKVTNKTIADLIKEIRSIESEQV